MHGVWKKRCIRLKDAASTAGPDGHSAQKAEKVRAQVLDML